MFKVVPGTYFIFKVLADQDKLEKCIKLVPDFLTLLENAKASVGALSFSLENKVNKVLSDNLLPVKLPEKDYIVNTENVETVSELGGLVKELDDSFGD